MKKCSFKKFYATLLLIVLILVFSAPFTAFAQTGTLGTESPSLIATFKDGDDVVVDGNALEAGSYTVDIRLKGMKAVSIFQITANTNNMTINSVSTIADVDSSFSCGAILNENNSFVAVLASENEDTSSIQDGVAMVTLNVTVNTAGDFAELFVVSTDPDLTFIEADYGDGYEDAYVCTGNTEEAYAMLTVDMSPSLEAKTFTVNGQIMIANSVNGTASDFGIGGITVSIDNTEISAVTDENGYYSLPGLEEGEYTMSIVGETTIDRKVTLIVTPEKANESSEISVNKVGIIICDYSKDTSINSTDLTSFLTKMKSYYIYSDFNADGAVNSTDLTAFMSFFNKMVNYDNITL